MLLKLIIDNYALIDKSVISFEEGFTVITGETGAGKSIMLDALSLLMGMRADSKAVNDKTRKMVVEAFFQQPDNKISKICEEQGIDWDPNELIIRREVTPNGKSRSFINDTPVNLSALSSVTQHLLDIHSQHSNSLINRPSEQLNIIDVFGNNLTLLTQYKQYFQEYITLRKKIKTIKENIAKGKENKDFLQFRIEQLDKLHPKAGELASLEREAELLGEADKIKSDLNELSSILGNGNYSVLRLLNGAGTILERIDFNLLDNKNEENILDRFNSIKIDLRDIADTIEEYGEKVHSDPERYEKVQKRIEDLYEAMKRFKVKDEEELIDLYSSLKEELSSISGEKVDLVKMESELKELGHKLKEKAELLSERRQIAADNFSKILIDKIRPLGLPNIKFQIDLQKGKMTSEGQDNIVFLCSFNKNHSLQPISEIASGGEISRVMLGIKSVMSENMNMPTIIFDEIDTGVSGEIAHKMGAMMQGMSKTIQVLAVTHLPQVAASGNNHLKVYKADEGEKTVSRIKQLSEEDRIKEIAGMLSGTEINNVALENAKILLQAK